MSFSYFQVVVPSTPIHLPVQLLRYKSEQRFIRGGLSGRIATGQADHVKLKPKKGGQKNDNERSQKSSTDRSDSTSKQCPSWKQFRIRNEPTIYLFFSLHLLTSHPDIPKGSFRNKFDSTLNPCFSFPKWLLATKLPFPMIRSRGNCCRFEIFFFFASPILGSSYFRGVQGGSHLTSTRGEEAVDTFSFRCQSLERNRNTIVLLDRMKEMITERTNRILNYSKIHSLRKLFLLFLFIFNSISTFIFISIRGR